MNHGAVHPFETDVAGAISELKENSGLPYRPVVLASLAEVNGSKHTQERVD